MCVSYDQMVTFVNSSKLPDAVSPAFEKKPRAPRSEREPDKSKALKHMLDWIRKDFDPHTGRIVATLVDFYECQAWSWELNYNEKGKTKNDNDVFWRLFHKIVDLLYTDEHCKLPSKAKETRYARRCAKLLLTVYSCPHE